MYLQHFGFSHPPFSISPDPRFLYLSPKHQEALAHLLYGLGEGGGFVMLSGEVGTGKTTLCYTLLEQLGDNVDVALILNPRLTSFELLAALCDELHVQYPTATDSRKVLVDALNHFLLANHARGRRTVAVIDEAQNLSSDVLEQVRLLTNLETPTTKLLQIVLVGQPELAELLGRPELRQVDQRITARYHLGSLDGEETRCYIRHRVSVAGASPNLFTQKALRAVFRFSGGIPRLINVICDRALLGAFALDRTTVDRRMVEKASREVHGRNMAGNWAPALAAGLFLGLAVASTWALFAPAGLVASGGTAVPGSDTTTSPNNDKRVAAAPPNADLQSPAEAALSALSPALVAPLQLAFMDWAKDSRHLESPMLGRLAQRWRTGLPLPAARDCERLRAVGLRCVRQRVAWNELRQQNLPALLMIRGERGAEHSVLLLSAGEQQSEFLTVDGESIRFPTEDVLPHWAGDSLALWEMPSKQSVLAMGMRDPGILWLRQHLASAGYPAEANGPQELFDEALKSALMRFQQDHGIHVDGIAGDETLAALSGIRYGMLSSSASLNSAHR